MKGRIVVEIEEIPEDCYQCDQPDEYDCDHCELFEREDGKI